MDVFALSVSISLNLDNFNTNLDRAQKKFKPFSDSISDLSGKIDKAYSGMGNLLKPAVDGFKAVESVGGKAAGAVTSGLKALAGAATVAAGGATMVGKSAFDAYANYEQLVGGVETLFKDSAGTVMDYADNTYKTAGMSANQYMELTTSFAASLLQSLGGDTKEAAKMADMADNWNKMGSDMRSVTDAYKGFAKQNYTMLDNLKLGYGGTKEEMQRLLADAEKFSGIKYDLSSYADIISAIHVIQEEMEITGTTAKEASTTIQGSVQSMKGAWENFMVGIADKNQNMKSLRDNLIESVVTAGNNVVPRIKEIVEQVVRVGPEVIRGFSEIIPEFARMGGEIVQTLANGIAKHEQEIWEFGYNSVRWIGNGITENAPKIGEAITAILNDIVFMIGENSDVLMKAGSTVIDTILSGFLDSVDVIGDYISVFIPLIVEGFAAKHEALFAAGMEILGAIGEGIVRNKDEVQHIASETITNMVTSLRDNAPMIIEGGLALLEALVGAIEENLPLIIEMGAVIIGKLVEGISTASPGVQAIIATAVLPHILKIAETVTSIGGAVSSVAGLVGNAINTVIGIGSKLMGGIKALFALVAANPVVAIVTAIIAVVVLLYTKCEWFRDTVHAVIDAVVGFFQGAWEAIQTAWDAAADFFGGIVEGIKGVFDGIGEFLGGLFEAAWETVQGTWDAAKEFFSDIAEGIHSAFEAVTGFLSDAFSTAWDVVSGVWGAATGFFGDIWDDNISGAAKKAGEAVGKAFKGAWDTLKSAWDGAISFFSGIASEIVGAFTGIGGKFLDIGRNIVDGIKNGISNAWRDFMGWPEGKVGGIVDGVKRMLGIHSPSTVFAGIGGNMALGLAEGWDDEYAGIKQKIESGLNFGTANVGVNAHTSDGAQEAAGRPGGWGNTTVNIYSPEAVDGVQAARVWKKEVQRMAISYV